MFRTPAHEFSALTDEFLSHVIVANELLEADVVQYASSNIKQRQQTQNQDCNRKIDIKPVRDERNHIHVTHYLCRNTQPISCSVWQK